jgi:hypothetical protein
MNKDAIHEKIKSLQDKKKKAYTLLKDHPCSSHIHRVLKEYDIRIDKLKKEL